MRLWENLENNIGMLDQQRHDADVLADDRLLAMSIRLVVERHLAT